MSTPKDPTRFTVSVERTVNLGNYESIRVGLAESFDVGSVSRDEAYKRVLHEVQGWAGSLKPAGTPTPAGNGNTALPPGLLSKGAPKPAASKLPVLQERLGARLQDLEVTDGIDGLVVKPRKYLGESWSEVNEAVRALGGHWISNGKQGSWRIPK